MSTSPNSCFKYRRSVSLQVADFYDFFPSVVIKLAKSTHNKRHKFIFRKSRHGFHVLTAFAVFLVHRGKIITSSSTSSTTTFRHKLCTVHIIMSFIISSQSHISAKNGTIIALCQCSPQKTLHNYHSTQALWMCLKKPLTCHEGRQHKIHPIHPATWFIWRFGKVRFSCRWFMGEKMWETNTAQRYPVKLEKNNHQLHMSGGFFGCCCAPKNTGRSRPTFLWCSLFFRAPFHFQKKNADLTWKSPIWNPFFCVFLVPQSFYRKIRGVKKTFASSTIHKHTRIFWSYKKGELHLSRSEGFLFQFPSRGWFAPNLCSKLRQS